MTSNTDEILRDIRRWVKVIGIQEAKGILQEELTHENEEKQKALRRVYHLTDGNYSQSEIVERVSYSTGWVSGKHSDWADLGLLERENPNSTYQHIITLEEAGIEVPEITEPDDDTED